MIYFINIHIFKTHYNDEAWKRFMQKWYFDSEDKFLCVVVHLILDPSHEFWWKQQGDMNEPWGG